MKELTGEQRKQEIEKSVKQLIKLGGAAVCQYRQGNVTGYQKIQEQIVEVGKRLKELGDISMMDAASERLEGLASTAVVREVIRAIEDNDVIASAARKGKTFLSQLSSLVDGDVVLTFSQTFWCQSFD